MMEYQYKTKDIRISKENKEKYWKSNHVEQLSSLCFHLLKKTHKIKFCKKWTILDASTTGLPTF